MKIKFDSYKSIISSLAIIWLLATHSGANPSEFAASIWPDEFNGSGPPNPEIRSYEEGYVCGNDAQIYK